MKELNIILLLISSIYINATDISFVTGHPEMISFDGKNLEALILTDDVYELKGEYKRITESKIPFISFSDNNEQYKYIVLQSNNTAFFGSNEYSTDLLFNNKSLSIRPFGYVEMWGVLPVENIIASSTLTEGNTEYSVKNTQKTKFIPWVEAVDGSGIGEYIEIEYQQINNIKGVKFIVISNGFVSYDKPHLYEENNRVKKIKVESKTNNFSAIYDIKDTPQLQEFILPEITMDLKITILDVYRGSKWDDTCINYIVGLREDITLEQSILINK